MINYHQEVICRRRYLRRSRAIFDAALFGPFERNEERWIDASWEPRWYGALLFVRYCVRKTTMKLTYEEALYIVGLIQGNTTPEANAIRDKFLLAIKNREFSS